MDQDDFRILAGDDDEVQVRWSRMTVRQPNGQVLVFYEEAPGTLVCHTFTILGEE